VGTTLTVSALVRVSGRTEFTRSGRSTENSFIENKGNHFKHRQRHKPFGNAECSREGFIKLGIKEIGCEVERIQLVGVRWSGFIRLGVGVRWS
jgi:hypothetical protein